MDVIKAGAPRLAKEDVKIGTPVVLASDNAGWELKHYVIQYLEACGIEYIDCNPDEGMAKDYPDWSAKAAGHIMDGSAKSGILICGTGIGIGVAAMKCPGVYCARCDDPMQARYARKVLDANVISFGQRVTGFGVALEMVYEFLRTAADVNCAEAKIIREVEKKFLKEV